MGKRIFRPQVALVKILANGSDVACYYNGHYIISANHSCRISSNAIQAVAQSLAQMCCIDAENIDVTPHADWLWNDIEDALKRSGQLCTTPASNCLFCASDSVTGESITVENITCYQKCTCDDCNSEWIDSYTLSKSELIGG